MRWRVENSIGAQGLPADAWAAAARARLQGEPAVERADIAASREEDEVDGGTFAALSVDVVVRGDGPAAAAALVQRAIATALWDVVNNDETGWTAYDWEARPAD